MAIKRETIWKASVQTTVEAEEAVAELLANLFAPCPSAYTNAETRATTVSAYTNIAPKNSTTIKKSLKNGLREIKRCGLDVGKAIIQIKKLPREDWAESWKRHFKPLEIDDRLLVKPSWSKRQPKKGQALVVLDPGLSFGTGQHPTTEFCLRQLVKHRAQNHGQAFLDMGTGSGILAIAAAKLGYSPIDAFDFDPQSVSVAKTNARSNRVQNKIRITRADLTKLPRRSATTYDVLCANLLANLLIAERDRILARLKPDGALIVAGILKREFHEVQHAYEAAGMQLIASKAQKEWHSGTFVRRPSAALDKRSKSARR